MRRFALALVFASISAADLPALQARPDFTGHWLVDPPMAENDPRVPICNRECFITQTSDALSVREQRTAKILSPAITFKFDGTPTSPPPREGSASQAAVLVFRANWKGEVLVIASESGAYKTVARLSLREGRLTIEGERGVPNPTFKASYRKAEADVRPRLSAAGDDSQ